MKIVTNPSKKCVPIGSIAFGSVIMENGKYCIVTDDTSAGFVGLIDLSNGKKRYCTANLSAQVVNCELHILE